MTRRSVNRQLGSAALTVAAVLALAGCGQATGSGPTAADDPAPTSAAGGGVSGSSGTADPDLDPGPDPSLAQWPAIGCGSRSVASLDYGRMAIGWGTPEEAVEHSPAGDIPDGVLTLAPAASSAAGPAKGSAQVWVVDPETNEIQAQVSVFRGPDGWFVDGVMTCSG